MFGARSRSVKARKEESSKAVSRRNKQFRRQRM
jgi:hypothetical protein